MSIVYNILTHLSFLGIWLSQWFSSKMKLFVNGRKQTFATLSSSIKITDKTIWFHCASLGEYEQGVPIMQAIKKEYPNYKLVVSFFSPSGYENKKNDSLPDVIVYLPLDTKGNAKRFIKTVHPSMVFFVKYEFWPNYLFTLQKSNIPIYLLSGLFRPNQVFFKAYGGFMKDALKTFNHYFLQNESSKDLLHKIGITNTSVSGDTRFDRVSNQIEQDNSISIIEEFKQDALCIVCGSTWKEDEAVLLDTINNASENVKFIVAPHKIEPSKISAFRRKITQTSILYSEVNTSEKTQTSSLSETNIFIIDTIGLLTKIYSYADIAYIGGAMGSTGLHNILEAATFGIPIVIGKHYDEFPEAKRLQSLAGLFSIATKEECSEIIQKLSNDASFRNKTGMIAGHFINSNTGATNVVMNHIREHFKQ
ncbi:3-deoxy-D-manno-octulosonic acid transferase [Patiriisocius hiemis]|uniref:3-deoxy-D-manno-octulosonic acid transferase n=1 Tax=Patiriisocius hiemis TaxID=3075604 RepID=A0ABU2YCI1_9FLAO|nr:glycosyltransferase N-terminal domain-containing protein [Constantimarinum sp. W242]MDT0555894.1 glycosyltransferase N-terminal domain-containing protein [Constantimarinum sp. W242]